METSGIILTTTAGLLFTLLYFAFAIFSVYETVTGKIEARKTTPVGKIIYYHGLCWIVGMIGIVIVACGIILSKYLLFALEVG